MRIPVTLSMALAAGLQAQPNPAGARPPLYETARPPAPAPARGPAGFTVVSRSGAIGQALTATLPPAQSARQAFRGAFRTMAGYFDGAPALVGAYGDPRDQQLQALFRASYRGARVTGFAMVVVSATGTQAALVFDQVEQVSRSFPVLMRALGATNAMPGVGDGGGVGGGGGGMAPAQPLNQTMLSDGSGSIGVPAGWRLGNAYQGIAEANGPHGQMVLLGYFQQVATTWFGQRPNVPGWMMGPYRDPLPALQSHLDSLARGALRRGEASFRLIEQAPTASATGQGRGAYITYELTASGKTALGFAYVSTSYISNETWMYYVSAVAAPKERFARDFPTMWAMWRSWSLNPAMLRGRMDAALQSMRETHRILQEAHANTQRTYDRVNHAWSQTIRGVTTIEHIGTGWRGDVDTNYVDRLVRGLNENGWDWRIVPMRDLLP